MESVGSRNLGVTFLPRDVSRSESQQVGILLHVEVQSLAVLEGPLVGGSVGSSRRMLIGICWHPKLGGQNLTPNSEADGVQNS